MNAHVARQPIFDDRKKISGYELLFRDQTARYNPDVDGDVATSTVLANSYFSIGMDALVGAPSGLPASCSACQENAGSETLMRLAIGV